jgi:hypothetical protein
MVQVVECLSSKHKALKSSPDTTKKKKKKEKILKKSKKNSANDYFLQGTLRDALMKMVLA